MQLIIRENPEKLVNILKEQGYSIITMTAEGPNGLVKMVLLVIKRKNLRKILGTIRSNNPKAFISVEQVKSVSGGNFPASKRWDLLKRKKIKSNQIKRSDLFCSVLSLFDILSRIRSTHSRISGTRDQWVE